MKRIESTDNLQIVFDEKYYYVKFKQNLFFGLIPCWWYILTDTPIGLVHRQFFSFEDAEKFVKNRFPEYIEGFKNLL